MRDYNKELRGRVLFIQDVLKDAGADGIVFGNSGGKDSALVGILCKLACSSTLGVLLPANAKRNFTKDIEDAQLVAMQYGIPTIHVDLSGPYTALLGALQETGLTKSALRNIAPRLRMTALYAIAASKNALVAGTGNRSEGHMGYFTKWGDAACDFNPIADLTVSEIYDFLEYLGAPKPLFTKPPSAGLYDGQTDEEELGVTYAEIDAWLLDGKVGAHFNQMQAQHDKSEHKRRPPIEYNPLGYIR